MRGVGEVVMYGIRGVGMCMVWLGVYWRHPHMNTYQEERCMHAPTWIGEDVEGCCPKCVVTGIFPSFCLMKSHLHK